MDIIGLTGGIGSGKSTVSSYLKEKGCIIIDSDAISRRVTEKGSPALNEIKAALGGEAFNADGSMNRKAVAALVFSDEVKRRKLEQVVTKRVIEAILNELESLIDADLCGIVIVDAPLLFEFNLDRVMDESWSVEADREERIRRVCARDGLTREQVLARMDSQLPQSERRRRADRTIDNSGGLEDLHRQLDELLESVEFSTKAAAKGTSEHEGTSGDGGTSECGDTSRDGGTSECGCFEKSQRRKKQIERIEAFRESEGFTMRDKTCAKATLLKGKPVADEIDGETVALAEGLLAKGVVPTLAILRVGENPSDIAYEESMVKKGRKLAIVTEKYIMAEDAAEEDVAEVIRAINSDDKIHGLIMFRPLPKNIDEERISNLISAEKDVDCISKDALARIFVGEKGCFAPCTAESVMELLRYYHIGLSGKNVVVIGRSLVIGKPVAMLLLAQNATVTVCHSRTPETELERICKAADVIVCAAGKAKMLTEKFVSEGQTIVDVGINFTSDGTMCGDVDGDGLMDMNIALTPVPGGVGSVTTSLLMRHVVQSALKSAKQPDQ